MPSLGVIGADGQLGSRIVDTAAELGTAVRLRGGRDGWAGDVPDVLIDVSAASALPDVVAYCRKHGVALVSATSGLGDGGRCELVELSTQVPVLRADNLSLGNYVQRRIVTVLGSLAGQLQAENLGTVDILDRHPLYKKDSPSATAVALRDRMLAATAGSVDAGIRSVRAGSPVCDHDLRLHLGHEEVVVRHSVWDRAAYSAVAVRAALWLAAHHPGLYTMDDFYAQLFTGKG